MGLQQYFDNKRIKGYGKVAKKIIEKHKEFENLKDEEIVEKTKELKERIKQGEKEENIKIEAFALTREAAKRVLGLEAYPVQLIGALILSDGDVAEMKTGEGKTLVSLFAIYYEAVRGQKVHLITANEYLAERDRNEIGKVLEFMGIGVGLNISSLSTEEKREVYKKDVIYGISSEFGFDYLRDNMVESKKLRVQSGLDFVLIDEADSILIDEARTPLIISGKKKENLALYQKAKMLIAKMKEEDFEFNAESNSVWLTESGIEKTQTFWNVEDLYSLENQEYLRVTNLMLRAQVTMKKDKDYVIREGEIVIVDQNTGRIMEGRRFSEGLHQAIEAKESVEIQDETMTLATLTVQNYFRMYKKIAGMTGTAKTEEEELEKIYGMSVLVVPTNKPIARVDDAAEIYLDKEAKSNAIVKEVKERYEKGQPILIGTSSISENEWLSEVFTKEGIPHQVLNAKNHEREAEIIANAGKIKAVTIATNMAGRGTDIKVDEEAKQIGGLAVIGTEKHDSRRVDNQLKGRTGRQGDPGYSKFVLSLEDDLIQRFNGAKVKTLATRLNFPQDEPIKNRMIVKAIEGAQKRIEGANFDARKNLLEYDEVMDIQRKFIYGERDKVMDIEDTNEFTEEILKDYIVGEVEKRYIDGNTEPLIEWLVNDLIGAVEKDKLRLDSKEEAEEGILELVMNAYKKKRNRIGNDIINQIEKAMFLNLIDQFWVRHLDQLVRLKEGIHLRSYAQTNPLVEYQKEASEMFQELLIEIRSYYSLNVFKFEIEQVAKG